MKTRFHAALLLTALSALWNCDSLAQLSWTKAPANPVVRGDPNSAWRKGVFAPCVLYNPDSSRFEMWFTASPTAGGGRPCKIGFAVSNDGVSWTIRPDPVLAASTGMWDSYSVEIPYVIRENGRYKMWYSGGAEAYRNRIGFATSADGINWSKFGEMVLGPGTSNWEAGGVGTACVVGDSGSYKMWYTGFTPTALSGPMCIGYATSADGVSWQRDTVHSPVVVPGATGSWDSRWISAPRVLFHHNKYYMWYTGASSGGVMEIGLASSPDGITGWTKEPGNPVLRPSQSGWDATDVECGTMVARGSALYMWYDGSPRPYQWQVGLATSPLTQVGEKQAPPTAYALSQNYPNPFNPSTGIRYQVPGISDVGLRVFDLLGREVATLVNERKTPGVYEVRFDASRLPSGVYYYRLTAGKSVQTKRMILVK